MQKIQRDYGGGTIDEPQLRAAFGEWMPNKSAECAAKLDQFFTQWWDTAYPTGRGLNRPRITGPRLAGQGFYDAQGGCSNVAVAPVSGTVAPTLSLTLGSSASFGTFAPGAEKTYATSLVGNAVTSAGDALLEIADPDAIAIAFQQPIGATDPLRTGGYSKTFTFTLSTTQP